MLNTHQIFSQDEAQKVAKELNSDGSDDWSYVVENNPKKDGPETAIIRIYDEDNNFVDLL